MADDATPSASGVLRASPAPPIANVSPTLQGTSEPTPAPMPAMPNCLRKLRRVEFMQPVSVMRKAKKSARWTPGPRRVEASLTARLRSRTAWTPASSVGARCSHLRTRHETCPSSAHESTPRQFRRLDGLAPVHRNRNRPVDDRRAARLVERQPDCDMHSAAVREVGRPAGVCFEGATADRSLAFARFSGICRCVTDALTRHRMTPSTPTPPHEILRHRP